MFTYLRVRIALLCLLLLTALVLAGCSPNIGVGLSFDVPVGDYGHISVGSGRWF